MISLYIRYHGTPKLKSTLLCLRSAEAFYGKGLVNSNGFGAYDTTVPSYKDSGDWFFVIIQHSGIPRKLPPNATALYRWLHTV